MCGRDKMHLRRWWRGHGPQRLGYGLCSGLCVSDKYDHILTGLVPHSRYISLSLAELSLPMLIEHLICLKVTVNSSIRTVQNPREDFDLRVSVWNFSPAVDTGLSLAGLLVTRKFKSLFVKGKKIQRHRAASATMENGRTCRARNHKSIG